jgi:hypothetical protein
MNMEKNEKTIYEKLLEVQKEINVMPKKGRNDFNHYNYLMEAQVTCKIKELFDKYGIFFRYNSELIETREYTGAKGDTQFMVTVKIGYAFVDASTKEEVKGVGYGQGMDKGDKGIYKAITGAIKYIYMKTFNIPTGDDAEKDSPEVTRPKAKANPQESRQVIDGKEVPTCSICGELMKPTKAGSRNPFYCKHGKEWGKPVFKEKKLSKEQQDFMEGLEEQGIDDIALEDIPDID